MEITDEGLTVKKIHSITDDRFSVRNITCAEKEFDSFSYVFSGTAKYNFGGKTVTAQKGDIVFSARGSSYTLSLKSLNFSAVSINFFFNNSSAALENDVYRGGIIERLDNTFIKCKRLWSVGDASDKIYCYSLLYRIYSDIVTESLSPYISSQKKQQLESAVNLVFHEYSNSDFSIKNLAEVCDISEVHFRRLFMQVYHTSPKKFITSFRLDKAKQMLGQNDFSISQIAEKCGFTSAYYFAKVFKQEIGMTPSEYKKNKLKSNNVLSEDEKHES